MGKKEILHLAIKKNKHWLYACNQAVTATSYKIAKFNENVTCKNCLRISKGTTTMYVS